MDFVASRMVSHLNIFIDNYSIGSLGSAKSRGMSFLTFEFRVHLEPHNFANSHTRYTLCPARPPGRLHVIVSLLSHYQCSAPRTTPNEMIFLRIRNTICVISFISHAMCFVSHALRLRFFRIWFVFFLLSLICNRKATTNEPRTASEAIMTVYFHFFVCVLGANTARMQLYYTQLILALLLLLLDPLTTVQSGPHSTNARAPLFMWPIACITFVQIVFVKSVQFIQLQVIFPCKITTDWLGRSGTKKKKEREPAFEKRIERKREREKNGGRWLDMYTYVYWINAGEEKWPLFSYFCAMVHIMLINSPVRVRHPYARCKQWARNADGRRRDCNEKKKSISFTSHRIDPSDVQENSERRLIFSRSNKWLFYA